MKTLPKTFTKNGFDFEQIDRRGDLAIYRKQKRNKCVSYEVVKITRHNGYEIGWQTIAPSEVYPSSESWGTNGFTVPTYTCATRKLALWKSKQ